MKKNKPKNEEMKKSRRRQSESTVSPERNMNLSHILTTPRKRFTKSKSKEKLDTDSIKRSASDGKSYTHKRSHSKEEVLFDNDIIKSPKSLKEGRDEIFLRKYKKKSKIKSERLLSFDKVFDIKDIDEWTSAPIASPNSVLAKAATTLS